MGNINKPLFGVFQEDKGGQLSGNINVNRPLSSNQSDNNNGGLFNNNSNNLNGLFQNKNNSLFANNNINNHTGLFGNNINNLSSNKSDNNLNNNNNSSQPLFRHSNDSLFGNNTLNKNDSNATNYFKINNNKNSLFEFINSSSNNKHENPLFRNNNNSLNKTNNNIYTFGPQNDKINSYSYLFGYKNDNNNGNNNDNNNDKNNNNDNIIPSKTVQFGVKSSENDIYQSPFSFFYPKTGDKNAQLGSLFSNNNKSILSDINKNINIQNKTSEENSNLNNAINKTNSQNEGNSDDYFEISYKNKNQNESINNNNINTDSNFGNIFNLNENNKNNKIQEKSLDKSEIKKLKQKSKEDLNYNINNNQESKKINKFEISSSNSISISPKLKNNLGKLKEYFNISGNNSKKTFREKSYSFDMSLNSESKVMANLENSFNKKLSFDSPKKIDLKKIKINCHIQEPIKVSFSMIVGKKVKISLVKQTISDQLAKKNKVYADLKLNSFCLMKNYVFIQEFGTVEDTILSDGDDIYIILSETMNNCKEHDRNKNKKKK